MKLAPLPVPTRCYAGEDLTSWATRHCSRNHTTVHAVERALFNRDLLHSHAHHDPERLTRWRQLGSLHPVAFTTPVQTGGVWVTSRDLCLRCTQGHPATGRLPQRGWCCLTHQWWTDYPPRHIAGHVDDDDRAPVQALVVAAERTFRRELAPRGVLVDSPLMLFALELAHLIRPGSSQVADSSTTELSRHYLRAAQYAVQIRWAQALIDPAVRAGLTDTSTVRDATINRVADELSRLPHICWEPSRDQLARVQIRWALPGGGYAYLDDEGDDPEQQVETWRVRQRLHRFSDRLTSDLSSAEGRPLPFALAGVP
ncbi:hypothetical protein [Microlunatus antarcticus]|uniref:TniQ protein n=1 Tax=Microlunatus antarcticus TaxID=53388 RepID=A0A7W5JVP2_9ACTN|nr:hypothetical protein [Microlunatus antarcticus]MBB3327119.1 hypothetical protein [Microlunatus antarcticus]